MAGLLDFFGTSWDDPRTAAVMAFGEGLKNRNFSEAANGYVGAMAAAKENAFKREMQQIQMDNIKSEIAQRTFNQEGAKRKEEANAKFWGGGGGTVNPQVIGGDFPMGGQSYAGQQAPQGGGLAGKSLEEVMAYVNATGNDKAWDAYKWAKDPLHLQAGSTYQDRTTGGLRYIPKVAEGIAPNAQGEYIELPMYGKTVANMEGLKTKANEEAKADFNLQKVTLPGGIEMMLTAKQLSALASGQPAMTQPARVPLERVTSQAGYANEAQMRNMVKGDMGADPAALAREIRTTAQEMQYAKDPESKKLLFGHLQDLQRQAQNIQNTSQIPSTAPQSAPSFGIPLQSQQEKDRAAALNDAYRAGLIKNAEAAAKNVSPSMMEELFKADDAARAGKSVISTLNEVSKINKDAYSGFGANARAKIMSNLPFESKSADATINLDNMLTGQTLESLKVIFGSNPTEGERAILLSMQASADKTPKQRQDIMDRAKEAAENRVKFNEEKAKSIRAGTYLNEPLKIQTENKNIIDKMPTANASNRGQRIRDTETGKILKSNGMSWVAE